MLNRSLLHPLARALVALLAVGMLASCGSDDGSADAPSDADPTAETSPPDAGGDGGGDGLGGDDGDGAAADDCPDEADVSAASTLEVELDPSSSQLDGCFYYSADGVASVTVNIEQPSTQTLEDVQRNLAGADAVEGIGDAAYEFVSPGGIVQFGVFEGDRYVLVTIDGAGPDAALGRAVAELFV